MLAREVGMKRHWPLVVAGGLVLVAAALVFWVSVFRWSRRLVEQYAPKPPAAGPKSLPTPAEATAARKQRLEPAIDPARAPLPTALPLVGGDGLLADGYPAAHVDGAALRSLLWHAAYADLNRYFAQLQDAFEADNRREYWIGDAADAFGSVEASLGDRLDAWVAATPDSFAPYLARGAYWNGVAWARRGARWAKDTPSSDMQAMRDAFRLASTDLDRALALRPKLVHARLLRVRVLTAEADHDRMRAEVDRATQVCPGCFRIRVVYLLNTTPRWGGTYPAMLAFASTCDPAVNVRCRALPGFVDYDKGDLAWTDSRLPEAEAALDRALSFGDCASFFLERAQIRRVRGNFAGALADADRAGVLWHAPVVLVARSEALYGLRRWDEAARTLLEALRIEPTESRAKAVAREVALAAAFEGWNEAKAGNLDRGLDLFDLAREIAPLDREIEGRRGQVLAGEGEKGLPALERAVDDHPDDLRLHQRLDYTLSMKGEFPRILDMWTTYIAHHPDDARAYMERAGTYHQLGRDAESRADARKACELGITEGCMRAGR